MSENNSYSAMQVVAIKAVSGAFALALVMKKNAGDRNDFANT